MINQLAGNYWHQRVQELHIDGRALINGERKDASDGATFASYSPIDGSHLADIASCTAQDVDEAVASARKAFNDGSWSRIGAAARKEVLLRLADLMEAHSEQLALLDSLDMGKPISQSTTVDAPGSVETFRWYAELVDKIVDEVPATGPGTTAMVTREPLGVVAVITPWNYPLEIAAWKLAPALAVGNSVIIKPAAQSTLSALLLGTLAMQAGIPAGVLNVVPGSGRVVGEGLALHMDVDALAFTGSTAVAKRLLECSGQSNMKRLGLEAGGKSANLVFDDVEDLEMAAAKAAFGAFYNQGEVCSANSRVLVQRGVYERFLEAFARHSADYAPGDPLDPENRGAGALVSREHADDVARAIEDARDQGRLVSGGRRLSINNSDAYIEPTIVADLPAGHPLHSTEIFGPVATVNVFDTEEEAIALANNTEYGLAASLWTSNLSRAHRVASRLVAGTVSVNTVDALGLTTPFGGFKQSGFGRDLSVHALDNYVGLKTTWFQHG